MTTGFDKRLPAYRAMCLGAAIMYPLFGLIYRSNLWEHAPDPFSWSRRIVFSLACIGLVALSYGTIGFRRHMWAATKVLLMLATLDVVRAVFATLGESTVAVSLLGIIALGNLLVAETPWVLAFDAVVLANITVSAVLHRGSGPGGWSLLAWSFAVAVIVRGALWFREQHTSAGAAATLSAKMRSAPATDAATGLLSRDGFVAELERMVQVRAATVAAAATATIPDSPALGIVMGDVNGLKLTNDIFGHAAGDELLAAVARALEVASPPGSLVARLGGDEFAVAVPHATPDGMDALIERIHEACDSVGGSLPTAPSISLGWSLLSTGGGGITAALRAADQLMYEAKRPGDAQAQGRLLSHIGHVLLPAAGESREHCLAVQSVAEAIGRGLGLDESLLHELGTAAFFHDIGKVAAREPRLGRGKCLQCHAEAGYRIAVAIPSIASAATAILHHHEHWDGSGLPAKLSGSNIPLYSRVICLADGFCAAASGDQGHAPAGKDEALRQVASGAGTLYDPRLVEILRVWGREVDATGATPLQPSSA